MTPLPALLYTLLALGPQSAHDFAGSEAIAPPPLVEAAQPVEATAPVDTARPVEFARSVELPLVPVDDEPPLADPPPVATAPPTPASAFAEPVPVATAALGEDVQAPTAASLRAKAPDKPLKTWLAVQSDIGVPDGLGVSAVVTPFEWLRLQFGAVGNGANAGVRGGITVLPKLWVVRPTFTVDAGRIFSGDPNPLLGNVLPADLQPLVQGVAWTFASARLGLEVGTRRGAVQLQAGGSYFDVELPGVAQVVQGLGGGTRITGGAPHIQKFIPSVRVGLIVALF